MKRFQLFDAANTSDGLVKADGDTMEEVFWALLATPAPEAAPAYHVLDLTARRWLTPSSTLVDCAVGEGEDLAAAFRARALHATPLVGAGGAGQACHAVQVTFIA